MSPPLVPETFNTPRLMAERLRKTHLDDLVALHLNPEVSRYLGGVRSPEVTREYLMFNINHWDKHGFGLWTLRTRDGVFAGRAGLRHLQVGQTPEVEVAYTLAQVLWGQGLASEIVLALTRIGLEVMSLPSLVGVVMIGNTASRHVLEKAGFGLDGQAKLHGEPCAVYRLDRASVALGG